MIRCNLKNIFLIGFSEELVILSQKVGLELKGIIDIKYAALQWLIYS